MIRLRSAYRTAMLGTLLSATVVGAGAQELPPVFAIVGAKIELGNGKVIDKGVVVLRDGLIEAVGVDVKVPPDAQVIKGDGLVVYPGFIDAFSSDGLKLPPAEPNQDVAPDRSESASPLMREANRKGVAPEVGAFDNLALTDGDLAPVRKAGFTTRLIAPTAGFINGPACLVNLSGRPKRDCVVVGEFGVGIGYRTGFGGGYPGSLLGLFAEIRQTFDDAALYDTQRARFASEGGRRPPADPVLAALAPTARSSRPFLFDADPEQAIVRSVKLAGELRGRPIVVGGQYAFKQIPLLAERKVSVIVGLNFGKEPGAPPKPPGAPPPGGPGRAGGLRGAWRGGAPDSPPGGTPNESPVTKPEIGSPPTAEPDDETKDLPPAALAERKRLWHEKVANAGKLNAAGVKLAFTTKGIRQLSDFWENLRLAVKEGLPRDAALRALTLGAAEIVGVEKQLGTIEPGKIAALTIMSGDFLDPKSTVRYLFIDDWKFEPEKNAPPVGPMRRGPRGPRFADPN